MRTSDATIHNRRWTGPLHRTAAILAAAILPAAILAAGPRARPESRPAKTAEQPPSRWESAIRAFEESDAVAQPPQGGILFIGSSSIRLWDVSRWFPGRPTIQRGFGGSQLSDSIAFTSRIVLPYRPRVIVLYAGDNDIAAGESPEQVAEDFSTFAAGVHAELPEARIVYIAIKPSIARWRLVGKMRRANELIRKQAEGDARLVFADIDEPMIGADGRPRRDLLAADGLHLSDAGYDLWASIIRPHLGPPEADAHPSPPPADAPSPAPRQRLRASRARGTRSGGAGSLTPGS